MARETSLIYTFDVARQTGNHGAKRIEIADAACKAILKTGLERTSLNDIARELGFTTGVLRHYFQDKEDLLRFTKNQLFDQMFQRMRAAAERETGMNRLVAMALENLPTTRQSIDMWRLLAAFNGRAVGNPNLMRLQQRRYARGASTYISEIERLQAAGEISAKLDPNLEGTGICAFVEGLAMQIILAPRSHSIEGWKALVTRYIHRTIG